MSRLTSSHVFLLPRALLSGYKVSSLIAGPPWYAHIACPHCCFSRHGSDAHAWWRQSAAAVTQEYLLSGLDSGAVQGTQAQRCPPACHCPTGWPWPAAVTQQGSSDWPPAGGAGQGIRHDAAPLAAQELAPLCGCDSSRSPVWTGLLQLGAVQAPSPMLHHWLQQVPC